jgi:hypothetical protein
VTWPTNELFYSTPSAVSLDPSTVGRYVDHCHILDHEDNDMMRPMQLLPMALQLIQLPDATINVDGINHFQLGVAGRFGETYRVESTASLFEAGSPCQTWSARMTDSHYPAERHDRGSSIGSGEWLHEPAMEVVPLSDQPFGVTTP